MKTLLKKIRLSILTELLIFLIIVPTLLFFLSSIDPNNLKGQTNYQNLLDLEKKEANTVADENSVKIAQIKDKYGINIKYGSDSRDLSNSVMAFSQGNEYIVYNNMDMLEKELVKYPSNFFEVFKNNDEYSLTIILVSSFTNDNLAIATKNKNNEFKIYISNFDKFTRAFHHEMFHVIEYYINSKNENGLFGDWSKYNPENFNYVEEVSKLDDEYVYNYATSNIAYFVTKYSKISAKEDRAELFAELMTVKEKPQYLNPGENVAKKTEYFTGEIKKELLSDTNNSIPFWSRFSY